MVMVSVGYLLSVQMFSKRLGDLLKFIFRSKFFTSSATC
jgi:hypothetical protein